MSQCTELELLLKSKDGRSKYFVILFEETKFLMLWCKNEDKFRVALSRWIRSDKDKNWNFCSNLLLK